MKKKYEDSILYKVLRPIVKILFMAIYTPKIIGKNNIPYSGRIIIAGNHTSVLDCIFLMSCTKRGIHFLAKKELWKGPKKILFANMGLIPVDRSKHDSNVLKTAKEYLNNEKVIGIFPEGTTEKGRGLLPFKIGCVKMAYDTDTMILPFVINGKYKMFSKDLKIVFEKPIKIKTRDLDKENEKLRDKINNMLGEI